jgi:hypothetical protein
MEGPVTLAGQRAFLFYARQGFERVGLLRAHARVSGTALDEVLTEGHLVEGC